MTSYWLIILLFKIDLMFGIFYCIHFVFSRLKSFVNCSHCYIEFDSFTLRPEFQLESFSAICKLNMQLFLNGIVEAFELCITYLIELI